MADDNKRSAVASGLGLAVIAGLTAAAAVIGGRATKKGLGPWFNSLRKPPFQPPNWVFGPVWTVLYGAMAVSAWRVWRQPSSTRRSAALGLWGVQLGLNAAWSVLFFQEHQKRVALADLGVLMGSIGAYSLVARKVDRPAAWLMAPYLGWCGFATALNEEIVRRNPE
jgi:tryptophan-rich sensory protein